MAATYHHARRLYIGTTAERVAVVLDVDGIGTDYWDTDVGVLYIWDGTAWVAGFAALPHDILSATHADTTPAVVVRGDLMTGQGVAPLWVRLAHPGAALRLLESTAQEMGWAATDDGNVADTVVRTDANAGIRPTRLGVGATVPNQDGVIATAEQAADPAFVVGVGVWLARNDAGEAKPFFVTDSGAPVEQAFELTEIVENVTITVGAAGDFVTIQGAVDWFKGRQVLGACIIDELDAASYDEAVVFEDILITPGSTLTLRGDQRVLAGLSYVDGSIANPAGLANGGTFNLANPCTLTVNAAGDQITVSGGTVDPDFDDGVTGVWGAGDGLLVFGNDDVIYKMQINAILGVNDNIIELGVALPAAAFPGGGGALDDGSAICLLPDRWIDRTVAGQCVIANAVQGLVLDGWYLESHTGASCDGIYVINGGRVVCENVAVMAEDIGMHVYGQFSSLSAENGACSVWGCAQGYFVNRASQMLLDYSVACDCNQGYHAQVYSLIVAGASISVNSASHGYRARIGAVLNANAGTARQCGVTGYLAEDAAHIRATNTNANNNGNAVDYNPAVSCVAGNCEAVMRWS